MSRWPQAIGTLALLAAAGSVGWRAAGQYETPAAQMPVRVAAPPPVPGEPIQPGVSAVGGIATPAHAAATSAATRALAPGEAEVCGVGIVKAEDVEQAGEVQARLLDSEALLMAHLARMKAHADPRTRAAALMVLRETGPLVSMAIGTTDPAVFMFAQQRCIGRDPKDAGSPCALLSAEQGARLDPDNGAAWLRVADEARLRGETDNMLAALHRMAASSMHEVRDFGFVALAIDRIPPSMDVLQRMQLVVALIGVQAALALHTHQAITTACPEGVVRDANRRALCDAIATHLVERGTLLIHTGIGRRIGERTGWTTQRVSSLAARQHALSGAAMQAWQATPGGPLSCAGIQQLEQWATDSARLGERGVAERWLAAQNLSDDELLARYREVVRQRAAAESASAPAR